VTVRKYLVLLAVTVFGSFGNVCLARGMREFGPVTRANWHLLLRAFANLWILAGVCLLILFFISYLDALSWADLTYVLPATAFGYVLTALLGKLLLQEGVPLAHWLGIGLIMAGVGFVAAGPAVTTPSSSHDAQPDRSGPPLVTLSKNSESNQ
jgi:drug/metabolite transporter (DMT)-like permease